jgi:hypothetical protein
MCVVLEETIRSIKGYASYVCQYYLTDTLTVFSRLLTAERHEQWVVSCLPSMSTNLSRFGVGKYKTPKK